MRTVRPGRIMGGVACVGLLVAGLGGCGSSEDVAVKVGSIQFSPAQVDARANQLQTSFRAQPAQPGVKAPSEDEFRRQAASSLVQEAMLDLEAQRCGDPCSASPAEIDKEKKTLITQMLGGDALRLTTWLRQQGIAEKDLPDLLARRVRAQKLQQRAMGTVTLSDAQVRAYWNKNRAQFRQPAHTAVFHILVPTRREADAIRATLTPANFAEVARTRSSDQGSAQRGGNVGALSRGIFVPAFEKAALGLTPGDISPPVKTRFGWHLIRVERVAASNPTFESKRADVKRVAIADIQSQRLQKAYQEMTTRWQSQVSYSDASLEPPALTPTTTAP